MKTDFRTSCAGARPHPPTLRASPCSVRLSLLVLLLSASLALNACGVRGPLKSPAEIEQKQKKDEKQPLPPSDTGV